MQIGKIAPSKGSNDTTQLGKPAERGDDTTHVRQGRVLDHHHRVVGRHHGHEGFAAYFLEAFVNIGLVPDGGATWMLTRLVGKARATEMMMLGERIAADKAEAWGLIHKAVDDADLMPQASALAERLAAKEAAAKLPVGGACKMFQ